MQENLLLEARNKAYELVTKKYKKSGHENRLAHIYGVAKMAKMLAKRYNVNELKAEIAGLMHDYYKYETEEEMANYIADQDLVAECKKTTPLFHAYASAKACYELVINDKEIYEAIKCHVYGKTKMTMLDKIIVISDYTEETREYKSCILCRDVLLNIGIDSAIWYSTKCIINMLENKKIIPNKDQYEILKIYEVKMKMEMLKKIKDNIDKVKGYDVICYDMKGVSPLFDYMFIVTIDSPRQADALATYIKEDYEALGINLRAIEGKGSSWVLMDCKDIIIHIFTREEREHYSLEKLYMEMPRVEL